MSKPFVVETTIAGPAPAVWATLTDWDNAARWMPGIDSMRADGPTAVGTNLRFHARGKERSSEIAAMEEGRSILLRSVQGGVAADYAYELSASVDGTTDVPLVATCETNGVLWGALGPIIRKAMQRADGGQLQALKAVVEGS